jgi:sulfopyruvate decarboxylase subunit beta
MLKGAGITCSVIGSAADFRTVRKKLAEVYKKSIVHAFLLSPAIWEGSEAGGLAAGIRRQAQVCTPYAPGRMLQGTNVKPPAARYTRYEMLKIISPWLKGKVVVCNLGIPSKELYAVLHQPSNFYMLGSMGMVMPIGLGISLTTDKEVVVIDGDGSILMNPGTLATVAFSRPAKLTIVAIDNRSYGSTGNQQTLTGECVDLELVAQGFGIHNSAKAATKKELIAAMKYKDSGPRFIHALAISGNSDAPNIPLGHIEIKEQVQAFLMK